MANCVGPDQTAPIGAVCSGSRLFASILNFSVMLGNYLQQTASANNIFRCIFFLGALRVKAGTGSQPLQAYRLGQWTACHKIHYLTLNAIFFNIREIHNAFFIMLISPLFSFQTYCFIKTLCMLGRFFFSLSADFFFKNLSGTPSVSKRSDNLSGLIWV